MRLVQYASVLQPRRRGERVRYDDYEPEFGRARGGRCVLRYRGAAHVRTALLAAAERRGAVGPVGLRSNCMQRLLRRFN